MRLLPYFYVHIAIEILNPAGELSMLHTFALACALLAAVAAPTALACDGPIMPHNEPMDPFHTGACLRLQQQLNLCAHAHASSQGSAALSPPLPPQLFPISPSSPPPPAPRALMAPPTAFTSLPPQTAPASGPSALRAAAGAMTKFPVSPVRTQASDRRISGRAPLAAHA